MREIQACKIPNHQVGVVQINPPPHDSPSKLQFICWSVYSAAQVSASSGVLQILLGTVWQPGRLAKDTCRREGVRSAVHISQRLISTRALYTRTAAVTGNRDHLSPRFDQNWRMDSSATTIFTTLYIQLASLTHLPPSDHVTCALVTYVSNANLGSSISPSYQVWGMAHPPVRRPGPGHVTQAANGGRLWQVT